MKCNRCGLSRGQSNECGTGYYCELFGEDVPEEFATYDGCNLMFNEAKKLCELLNDSMRTYYDSLYKYYVIGEELTKEQQADIDRIEKEHDLAYKKYNNYYDVLLSRRKKK